jgi:hypothetical protein
VLPASSKTTSYDASRCECIHRNPRTLSKVSLGRSRDSKLDIWRQRAAPAKSLAARSGLTRSARSSSG